MIPVKHIDPDDLPLYAMQLLARAEMDELREDLQHSSEARRMLADIYADLSLFAHTAEVLSPSSSAKQRLMKHVSKERKPQAPAAEQAMPIDTFIPRASGSSLLDEHAAEHSFTRKAVPWAGWLIAAGLAAFAFVEHQQTDELNGKVVSLRAQNVRIIAESQAAQQVLETLSRTDAVHATLVSTELHPVPTGRVTYVADKGSLVFLANNLDPLQPAKTYELWVIPADGRAPIAAGTFKPDARGNAIVMLPELSAGIEAKAFGVTIEDGAGSTVPTAPIILKGLPS